MTNIHTFTAKLATAVKIGSIGIALTAAASGVHAAESVNSLGLLSGLNLLAFGDFSAPSSDVEGRVLIGGNANMSSYSVNTKGYGALYSGTGLTVGGNLSFANGSSWGDTIVGGNLSVGTGASFGGNVQVTQNLYANNNWLSAGSLAYGGSAQGLNPWQDPAPIQVAPGSISLGVDIAAERLRLTNLSQSFDSLTNTNSASNNWGTLALNANGASLAVFDLASADAAQNLSLYNLGANTTVLINVHGTSVDFGNHGYENFSAGRVLFNLPEATSVSFSGGVNASFLAPLANFSSSSGLISGQVVVANWSGTTQLNDAAFNGNISPVPEPQTYAMLLAGLAAIGFAARRRAVV